MPSTALHDALYQQDGKEVARQLRATPTHATQKDASGCLPLHLAIRLNGGSGAESLAVLAANPSACQVVDRQKRLPLHLALLHKAPPPVQLAVLVAYPEACLQKDFAGDTPLNLALVHEAAVEVQQAVLAAFPRACWEADQVSGNLPLHAALQFQAPPMIQLALLVAHPDACATKNKRGQLPYDIGSECRASVDIMTALRYHTDIATAVADSAPWDLPGRYTLAVGVLISKGCATYREKGHQQQGQPLHFPAFLPPLSGEMRRALRRIADLRKLTTEVSAVLSSAASGAAAAGSRVARKDRHGQ